MDDQRIWDNIVQGEVNALKKLHDKYYHPMWLWASNFLQSEENAKEAVSDCFIKIWEHREHIFIEKSVKSYLFLMLRNRIINTIKQTKNRQEIHVSVVPDIPNDELIDRHEFYAELYTAINKIPDQRRKILELAAFESLTYKEIAQQLNISVNTVKTQMGRAYQFLKEELDPKNFLLLHLFGWKKVLS